MDSQPSVAIAAVILAVAGSGLLVWRYPAVRGTTLLGPWAWMLVTLAMLATVELVIAWAASMPAVRAEALRFTAAVTVFCPLMALLGAKRPQHQPWQFVVLSLWVILALPAAQVVLFSGTAHFAVHPARQWFFVVLILMGAMNALPTRFWAAALLLATGRLILVATYLPLVPFGPLPSQAALGMALLVLAIAVAAVQLPNRPPARHQLDRLWLDFRDLFGVLWSLRVAEGLNTTAARQQWKVALTWRGFRAAGGQAINEHLAPDQLRHLEQTFKNLLRRFVSPRWIDVRLGNAAAAMRRDKRPGKQQ